MRSDDNIGTSLQFYTGLIIHVLESARTDDELGERGYRTLIDIAFRRVTSEVVRVGLDEWREAA